VEINSAIPLKQANKKETSKNKNKNKRIHLEVKPIVHL
jgi:hypothetical protein